jgi:hypothetical protein
MIELGDQPEPEIEPAEPPPGGVDAVDDVQYSTTPVVPDLTGLGSAPLRDEAPAELSEPEETGDGVRTDGAGEPLTESPA